MSRPGIAQTMKIKLGEPLDARPISALLLLGLGVMLLLGRRRRVAAGGGGRRRCEARRILSHSTASLAP